MARLMKAWTIDTLGAENLKITERPVPEAGPGEVLVRTTAVSLNFRDKLVLENGMGMPLSFPFVPGSDMAGVVEAVGSGVTRFQPGERVISVFDPTWIDGQKPGTARHPTSFALGGLNPGVASQYVAFPEDWFVKAPESLDDGEASTLPCAGVTAWFALVEKGHPKAGDRVVVQGTGGVSLFGLQIAKAHGAEVIVTSASQDKLKRALALGADHGINRLAEDWAERVLEITGDRGADHILEIAGGANLGKSLQAVAVQGRISVIGVFEGAEISAPVTPVLLKSPVIQGIGVAHRRALADLVGAIDRTGIKPVIDARYPFERFQDALAHLDRGPFGKVVVEF
ncbi:MULTISPECIES: NAD(P)-dependent alcohol dehydrogenase [unclassified Ensifer]|uniref:zinc-dependent alcohol dehydrogenase family protein n=1 Tax=unclassified Ensifer TaxID=2633371 RepID=UPI000813A29D|nr:MULTISPECIES: NAD(P)-dependent alcohol dehydrogenase [unclassified Ensifer]OCP02375.1 alcohol dehydrogenase [Ensifer sp. LC14]OCP14140.1 alcohol dehydrogenase [Ensifer sp. LC13]OCP14817.1 alcohol dehydrogenase [Ensifer sp. LC11]OCP34303.1 alcohol dehydrogenase [Ensifer sp. LC499]